MSFNFTSKIDFAITFEPENRLVNGFKLFPIKQQQEDPNDSISEIITVICPENEAEAYAVYAMIQDGKLELPLWIADLDNKESAERFAGLLNVIKEEMKAQTALISRTEAQQACHG